MTYQQFFRKKTLKNWVRASSGDNSEEDTPVPIPNTEVKLFSADDTWRVTARESRTSPDKKVWGQKSPYYRLFRGSSMVEQPAVNR